MSTLRVDAVEMRDGLGHPSFVFDNLQELKDSIVVRVGQKVSTHGYTSVGDGGDNSYEIVDAATGIDDGGSLIDLPGTGFQAKGLFLRGVNIKQFGAIDDWDGIAGTDNTSSIQAALDFGRNMVVSGEQFYFAQTLTMTNDGQSFVADRGCELVFDTTDGTAIQMSGVNQKISISLDLKESARIGIEALGDAQDYDIFECRVVDVRSETAQAFGIVSRSGRGGRIHNNEVRNIFSLGDGTSGNGNGLSRAIQYVPDIIPIADTHIVRNRMYDVLGEEGDVISVQVTPAEWDGVHPFPDSRCFIKDNYAENWTRRFVKCQGSQTVISNNECYVKNVPDPGHAELFAISIIASNQCLVQDNDINCGGAYFGFNTDGSGVHTNFRNRFIGNNVRNTGDGNAVVSIRQSDECLLSGGSITSGPSDTNWVSLSTATGCSVKGVKLYGGTTTGNLISSTVDSSGNMVDGNESYISGADRFINVPSGTTVVTNNVSMGTNFANGVIGGNDPGSAGSVIRFNTALTPGSTMLVNFGTVDVKDTDNIAT